MTATLAPPTAATARPTWHDLANREPRLAALAIEVASVDGDDPQFCANRTWYDRVKPRLLPLVGWDATGDDPLLASAAAYDIAYEHLYDLLPPCRDCLCL